MSDHRFEELLSRLLDGDTTPEELFELAQLASDCPGRQQELQAQLEADDMLAQSEDNLRRSPLFLAAVQSRIGDDPFVNHVRSALSGSGKGSPAVRPGFRSSRWAAGLAAAVAVLVLTGLFLLRPEAESKIATITGLNGFLQWSGEGGHVQVGLEAGQSLGGGTLESLSADSWGTLEFRDGTTVTVYGRAALTISNGDQKDLHLREGNLSAGVTPQADGRPLLIHTPTAKLEVLGTKFDVVAEQASTILTVNEGHVRATRLADGSVSEVPAEHQVVASLNRQDAFRAIRRPDAVTAWQSKLPEGIVHGLWLPEMGGRVMGLRGTRLLQKDSRNKPIVFFLAAGAVSPEAPVALRLRAMIRVRGKTDTPPKLTIGITVHYPKGGFAGKYVAIRRAEHFAKRGGFFDLQLPVDEFAPNDVGFPASPVDLELRDWWCSTTSTDAGLSILEVELIPTNRE